MTDTTATHLTDAVIAAKGHAQMSWHLFTKEKGLKSTVLDWTVGRTEDGSPALSGEVVGPGAAHALLRFVRDFYLTLRDPGDQRPQFDIHAPAGRTVLVWRYAGVWVELWHPDSVADAPQAPQPVLSAPAPVPAASVQAAPTTAAGLPARTRRRPFLGPGGRLTFTRKQRTTNDYLPA